MRLNRGAVRPSSDYASALYTINNLNELHQKGIITDAEFRTLITAVGSSHLEHELTLVLGAKIQANVIDQLNDMVIRSIDLADETS